MQEERIFSMVRKTKTCFRPNLDLEETLGSLITGNLATEKEPIHKIKLSQEVLDKAKKARGHMFYYKINIPFVC